MKPEKLFKEINDLHAANIGHAQSTAENAVIIGVKFHQLKEVLPHGEFEEAARKSTKISDPTRSRYMLIAEERLIEQRALKLLAEDNSPDGKSFTVKLLDDPDQQAIPAEIRDQARAQVRADDFKWTALDIKPKDLARGLESTDIMALFRAYKAIREKKPKQHIPPRQLTPDELIAAENAQAESHLARAEDALTIIANDLASKEGILSVRISPARWKAFLRACVQVTKAVRPLTKRKLSPSEKKQEQKTKAKALLSAVTSCQTALAKTPSDKSAQSESLTRK